MSEWTGRMIDSGEALLNKYVAEQVGEYVGAVAAMMDDEAPIVDEITRRERWRENGALDGQGPGVVFNRLSRAPGDGTATNGKIIVNDPGWISPTRELYPSVFNLSVVRRPGAVSPYDLPFIPADFSVRPLAPGQPARDRMTCGACGRS